MKGMTTAKDIYYYIDEFAPFSIQDKFDNSGFLVGREDKEIKKAAVCLDITNSIIEEAKENGADIIISHHPVIFKALKKIDPKNPVYKLIAYDIPAVCAHTNVDMFGGGISDIMYSLMGYGTTENAEVLHTIHSSSGLGYGKIKELDTPVTADELAKQAKSVFDCTSIKYCDGGKPIKRVAVCGGAGNDEIYTAIDMNVDAIITGDVKHHGFVDAMNYGISVIDAGHYHTEVIVCKMLAEKLKEKFGEIEFFIPQNNAEVCKYI